jgi:hypothetical protein
MELDEPGQPQSRRQRGVQRRVFPVLPGETGHARGPGVHVRSLILVSIDGEAEFTLRTFTDPGRAYLGCVLRTVLIRGIF